MNNLAYSTLLQIEKPFLAVAKVVFPEMKLPLNMNEFGFVSKRLMLSTWIKLPAEDIEKSHWNPIYDERNPIPYFKDIEMIGNNKEIICKNTKPLMELTQAEMEESFIKLTHDGHIKKRLIRPGDGNKVTEGKRIAISYDAFIFNMESGKLNSTPFDSTQTWENHEDEEFRPIQYFIFDLNSSMTEVIPVIHIGVSTMEQGEKAEFIAGPKYAFGSCGLIDKVPPNSTVVFSIHLVKIFNPTVPKAKTLSLKKKKLTGIN